uniref:Pentapeptide repeat-containing protein n=1 Tax=viral metagenome TaxID=1070528 RepID=A0A6C0CB05_9ZZZZ
MLLAKIVSPRNLNLQILDHSILLARFVLSRDLIIQCYWQKLYRQKFERANIGSFNITGKICIVQRFERANIGSFNVTGKNCMAWRFEHANIGSFNVAGKNCIAWRFECDKNRMARKFECGNI